MKNEMDISSIAQNESMNSKLLTYDYLYLSRKKKKNKQYECSQQKCLTLFTHLPLKSNLFLACNSLFIKLVK